MKLEHGTWYFAKNDPQLYFQIKSKRPITNLKNHINIYGFIYNNEWKYMEEYCYIEENEISSGPDVDIMAKKLKLELL